MSRVHFLLVLGLYYKPAVTILNAFKEHQIHHLNHFKPLQGRFHHRLTKGALPMGLLPTAATETISITAAGLNANSNEHLAAANIFIIPVSASIYLS